MNHSKKVIIALFCLIWLCGSVCNAQDFMLYNAANNSSDEITITSIRHYVSSGKSPVTEDFNIVFIVNNGNKTHRFVDAKVTIPAGQTITKKIPNNRENFDANSTFNYDFRVTKDLSNSGGGIGSIAVSPPSANRQGALNNSATFQRTIVLKEGNRQSTIIIKGTIQ